MVTINNYIFGTSDGVCLAVRFDLDNRCMIRYSIQEGWNEKEITVELGKLRQLLKGDLKNAIPRSNGN